jgi:hypothetical protein
MIRVPPTQPRIPRQSYDDSVLPTALQQNYSLLFKWRLHPVVNGGSIESDQVDDCLLPLSNFA